MDECQCTFHMIYLFACWYTNAHAAVEHILAVSGADSLGGSYL